MLCRFTLATAAFIGSHYVGRPDDDYCYNAVRRFHVLAAKKEQEEIHSKQQGLLAEMSAAQKEKALYLKKALSLNPKELDKLLARHPKALGYRSEENVEPKLQYLQERLSLNEKELSKMVQA